MRSFIVFVAIIACASAFVAKDAPSENGLANLLAELGGIKGGMVPMREGRIVGGDYAPIETVPWACSQQRLGSHRCGCAIISSTVTLTAAHCNTGIPPNGFSVRAGSTSKSAGGQLIPTRNVINHPSFNEAILEHDISILVLEWALDTQVPGVTAINMQAAGNSLAAGTMSLTAGWGAQYENGAGSDTLRSVWKPTLALADCNLRLGGGLTHDMMCAGVDDGGVGACDGDAGSPLVANNVLVGVMSWSIGCARPGLPTVYSRISTARTWIDFEIAHLT